MKPLIVPLNHVANINVIFNAVQTIQSSIKVNCTTNTFDSCISEQRSNLNTSCNLPFENFEDLRQKPICSTYKEGSTTLKSIAKNKNNCHQPCLQLVPQIEYNPKNYLLAIARPKVVDGYATVFNEEFAYYFKISEYVKVLKSKSNSSVEDILGDFASMAGIFLGISLVSFVSMTLENLTVKIVMKKVLFFVMCLGISLYLTFLLIVLLIKFNDEPHATSINFIKTTSDFSLSICSLVYFYDVQSVKTSQTAKDNFLPNNITFWKKWKNESTMIDYLYIKNGTYEIDLLTSNSKWSFSMMLENEYSMTVCHTFDLISYNSVPTINISYNTQLDIYMHTSGQFIQEWRTKGQKLVSSSPGNTERIIYSNYIEIFDVEALVNFEIISRIDSESASDSFDTCYVKEAEKILGRNLVDHFFTKKISDIVITENDIIDVHDFMHNYVIEDACKASGENLKINFQNTINEQRKSLIVRDDVSTDIESMTMKDRKPCIVITISEFTKHIKVRFYLYYHMSLNIHTSIFPLT